MTSLLSAGAVLHSRYKVIRLLGKGGMGAVYLAEDQNLPGRHVAAKENFDPSRGAQDQFKREAIMLARMKHPNLPQVTDHFIEPSGRQYLVMDYVEGEDLDEILGQRGPSSESEVLGWIEQVLDALEYMHTWVDPVSGQPSPVIHRDIKPANIKRTPEGRIMLVDFGIAKLYQHGQKTTAAARAVTPGFSPPEQYTGGTDTRSDIYALGATLYCLLTGEVPPESPAIAAGKPLTPPRALNSGVTTSTERVILKAMQIQPANRYQTVRALRQAMSKTTAVQVSQQEVCAACSAANRATAKFCFACGATLQRIPPFTVKRVTAWSASGALLGLILAYLPRLAVPGGTGLMLEAALYSGALFFCIVGATIGALIARAASIDAPDFVPKVVIVFVTTVILAVGFSLTGLLISRQVDPLLVLLTFPGSVGGAMLGARLTETETFRNLWQ